MKYLIYIFISIFLTACVATVPSIQDNKNNITINMDNTIINIPTNGKQRYKVGNCLQKSYFFENENVQVEYISVKSRCTWTGLPDGYYQDFLRKELKGLVKSESIKLKNGDLYKFNQGNSYFYLISLFSADSNTFILDYTGDIASKMINKNLTIDISSQLSKKLKKSLLENYQFKGFFESDRSEHTVIIPIP